MAGSTAYRLSGPASSGPPVVVQTARASRPRPSGRPSRQVGAGEDLLRRVAGRPRPQHELAAVREPAGAVGRGADRCRPTTRRWCRPGRHGRAPHRPVVRGLRAAVGRATATVRALVVDDAADQESPAEPAREDGRVVVGDRARPIVADLPHVHVGARVAVRRPGREREAACRRRVRGGGADDDDVARDLQRAVRVGASTSTDGVGSVVGSLDGASDSGVSPGLATGSSLAPGRSARRPPRRVGRLGRGRLARDRRWRSRPGTRRWVSLGSGSSDGLGAGARGLGRHLAQARRSPTGVVSTGSGDDSTAVVLPTGTDEDALGAVAALDDDHLVRDGRDDRVDSRPRRSAAPCPCARAARPRHRSAPTGGRPRRRLAATAPARRPRCAMIVCDLAGDQRRAGSRRGRRPRSCSAWRACPLSRPSRDDATTARAAIGASASAGAADRRPEPRRRRAGRRVVDGGGGARPQVAGRVRERGRGAGANSERCPRRIRRPRGGRRRSRRGARRARRRRRGSARSSSRAGGELAGAIVVAWPRPWALMRRRPGRAASRAASASASRLAARRRAPGGGSRGRG